MENRLSYIVRHSIPNLYDHAPQGTLCKVVSIETNTSEHAMIDGWQKKESWYKQINKESTVPRWEKII